MVAFHAEIPPLIQDDDQVVRVRGTRVTLDSIVGEYEDGATAEEIVQRYPTLALAEVYAVLAYYLKRRPEVEEYLASSRTIAEAVRSEYSKQFDQRGIRDRLLARRGASGEPPR